MFKRKYKYLIAYEKYYIEYYSTHILIYICMNCFVQQFYIAVSVMCKGTYLKLFDYQIFS